MERITCPYLGLKEDPATSLDFASEGNFCHRARPISPVKRAYQEKFCLGSGHKTCPLYLSSHPLPMPRELMLTPQARLNARRMLVILGIPALIAGTAVFAFAYSAINAQSGQTANALADTGGDSIPGLMGVNQEFVTPTPGVMPSPTEHAVTVDCPVPAGWVQYLVQPTDSLYRISVIYGVSLEQLQQVNCMGTKTLILPGQVIYVPNLPTDVPTPTYTPVPYFPPVVVGSTGHNNPQPSATSMPPTKVPTQPPQVSSPVPTVKPPAHQFRPPKPTSNPDKPGKKKRHR